jgi:hypothetical protein
MYENEILFAEPIKQLSIIKVWRKIEVEVNGTKANNVPQNIAQTTKKCVTQELTLYKGEFIWSE